MFDSPSLGVGVTLRWAVRASRVPAGTVGAGRKDGRSRRDACEAYTGILGAGSSRISDSPSPFRDAVRRFLSGSPHA